MPLTRLIAISQCRPNSGTFIRHRGVELAVFHLTEPTRFIVVDNACPHAGGNLSAGTVEAAVVECPWHQWRFDLDRAVCVESEKAKLVRYPVEVRDGDLYVDLDAVP